MKVTMQQSIKCKLSRPTRGLLYRAKKSLDKNKKMLTDCRELMVQNKWKIDRNLLRTALEKC
jgi:hypothetical protein